MFDKLEKHHIGIVITNDQRETLELQGIVFKKDLTQGAHVAFVMDNDLGIYREYIVQEGRAANIKPGFYHFCYNIPDSYMMQSVENFISDNKLGFPITKLEKSESNECGWVRFYFLKHHGIVEFNLINYSDV